jgi:polysaccharide deacetylase family protein (PEP-CTERM system associated)
LAEHAANAQGDSRRSGVTSDGEWPTPDDIRAAARPLVLGPLDRPVLPPPRCALTIDVEDWFDGLDLPPGRRDRYDSRVVAASERLLAMLADHGVRATFFVLGRVAEAHPDLVERILAAGHDVGSHGHEHQFAYRSTPDAFARDLDASLAALARAGAPRIVDYRAPFFSVTRRSLWALDALAAAGIVRDSSIMPASNPRYGIPSAPLGPHLIRTARGHVIQELPVSCLGVGRVRVPFAGGFYLRAFPLRLVQAAIRWTLARGRPVVLYLHPWELDPKQPRLTLPTRIAATRYHRLDCTARKLDALLASFRWGTLAEVADGLRPGYRLQGTGYRGSGFRSLFP